MKSSSIAPETKAPPPAPPDGRDILAVERDLLLDSMRIWRTAAALKSPHLGEDDKRAALRTLLLSKPAPLPGAGPIPLDPEVLEMFDSAMTLYREVVRPAVVEMVYQNPSNPLHMTDGQHGNA